MKDVAPPVEDPERLQQLMLERASDEDSDAQLWRVEVVKSSSLLLGSTWAQTRSQPAIIYQ
jgi:hypothetical protein